MLEFKVGKGVGTLYVLLQPNLAAKGSAAAPPQNCTRVKLVLKVSLLSVT